MFGAIAGLAGSLLGASSAAKAARAQQRMLKDQANVLNNIRFNPWGANFGGAGVDFSGGQANFNMGQFGDLNQLFSNLALGGTAGGLGMQNAANASFGQNEEIANALAALGAGQAGQLSQQGFQQGLQNQLFGQAGQLAGQTDFSALRDETLGTLRQQAQPFEERAFSSLQDNLFSTGRLGSSGGALQTEAFARGLGQADLQRQLQATGVAQQQQQQNANIANMFGGLGSNIAGLESQLLNNAFGRFGQTAGLAADLNQMRFGRGSTMFGQGLQGFEGQTGIMDNLLRLGTFGANLGSQAANTQLQGASAAGGMLGGAAQQATGGDIMGGLFSSLGSGLFDSGGGFGSIFSGLKGLFGNNSTTPQPGVGGI